MKTIRFRWKLCVSYIIIVCLLLTFVWIELDKRLQRDTRKVAESTVKTNPIESNYSYINRVMDRSAYRIQPRLKPGLEVAWQRILAGSRLMLGFSFSRRQTRVRYVLGVSTVHRKDDSYLLQTLTQLIEEMSEIQRASCLIVVCIGETDNQIVQQMWQKISETFGPHLDSGFIDVISPPANYYPDWQSLKVTLHDEPERVRWRTKQTLDYMFLMTYAQGRGDYYLQLEDDISPNIDYFDYIIKLTALHSNFRLGYHRKWIVMSFCDLGFIGKLFHSEELKPLLDYVQIFYNDQPIDWLLQSYVKLRCCRWDSFHMPSCNTEYNLCFIRSAQSQFQHIGLESSLRAKAQLLHDSHYNKDSGRVGMFHLRQPFNLINSHRNTIVSNMKDLRHGETFIWGYMPQTSSLLHFIQAHQYNSGQIRIRSVDQSVNNFSELTLDVLEKRRVLDMGGSEMRRCGFIMSYTHQIGIDTPYLMYFYMSETSAGNNEISWFRRISWSGKATTLVPSFGLQVWGLLWMLTLFI